MSNSDELKQGNRAAFELHCSSEHLLKPYKKITVV